MTPTFVVDSSLAMAWCFFDEATPATKELLDRMSAESAVVPAGWYLELTNALVVAERRGRIDATKAAEFINLIEGLSIESDSEAPERAFQHILPLCRAHQLTSYDAMYLDLAVRRQLPLVTLDEPLRKAAKKMNVKLLGR